MAVAALVGVETGTFAGQKAAGVPFFKVPFANLKLWSTQKGKEKCMQKSKGKYKY